MLNPELVKGDRIRLLYMDGENSIPPGTWGTVTSVDKIFGDVQYGVNWDDGDKDNVGKIISSLALISETDAWDKGGPVKKHLKENREDLILKNLDLTNYFKVGNEKTLLFLVRYLKMVRKTGLVNMFMSAPFLYMGSQYIDRHYGDQDPDEEAFQEVLDNADTARNYMIAAAMNIIDEKSEGLSDEETDRLLNKVSKYVKDLSQVVLKFYMSSF